MIKFLTISNNCNRQSSQKHVENNFSKQKSLFPVIQLINAERLRSSQQIEVRSAFSTSQLVHNLFISLQKKRKWFLHLNLWISKLSCTLYLNVLAKSYFCWNRAVCVLSTGGSYREVLASVTALYSGFQTTLPLIKHLYSHPGFKISVEKCLWRPT